MSLNYFLMHFLEYKLERNIDKESLYFYPYLPFPIALSARLEIPFRDNEVIYLYCNLLLNDVPVFQKQFSKNSKKMLNLL